MFQIHKLCRNKISLSNYECIVFHPAIHKHKQEYMYFIIFTAYNQYNYNHYNFHMYTLFKNLALIILPHTNSEMFKEKQARSQSCIVVLFIVKNKTDVYMLCPSFCVEYNTNIHLTALVCALSCPYGM